LTLGQGQFDGGDRVVLDGGRGSVPAELVLGPVVRDPGDPPGAALEGLVLGEVQLPDLMGAGERVGERSPPLLGQPAAFTPVVGLEQQVESSTTRSQATGKDGLT
jgi:hypothetical protein